MAALSTIAKQSGGGHTGDVHSVAVDRIQIVPGFNYRDLTTPDAVAKIRAMADEMLDPDIGFNQNKTLLVRMNGDVPELIDGHRRLAAVTLANSEGANIQFVPCQSEAKGTTEVERDYELFSTGEPLTIQEKAVGVKRQLNRGQTYEQVAKRLWVTVQTVKSWLDLSGADEAVLAMINRDEIAETTARQTVQKHGSRAAPLMAKALEHAQSKGRKSVKPRDIAAVDRPRTEPPSLASLVALAMDVWEAEADLDEIMTRLRDHPLVVALRRKEAA